MIAIDLFAGAGGMSLGAKMAGVDVQLVVESDPYAAATYIKNHKPKLGLFNDDIRNFKKENHTVQGRPLIIFGGPPCQGFSTSNQKTRSIQNDKNWLFQEFMRVVNDYMPDWVVFENVRGILETENGIFVEQILKEFSDLGYETAFQLLHATDFGIPQRRARFFIVASLNGIKFKFPEPTTKKLITVNDAISDLPLLENGASKCVLEYSTTTQSKYAKTLRGKLDRCSNNLVTRNSPLVIERYSHIPQAGNWENIPDRLMKNYKDKSRCHTGIYRRLEENKPSIVIGNFRKNMLIHPTQNRGLSVREAARLQSFPDWFNFSGSIGFQQQQVGNAVPPLLAAEVFKKITSYSK
ncbi:DNA cytosine methyltransferase [Pseudomonas sp. EA_15y_Pfl1_P104]|uniref:DNA cytosine methyltransferase n=1 Tax=Pseudomonas sp. EA_15y_Pfl1_P104 TaxID=3088686 RepID=UPI0030D8863E